MPLRRPVDSIYSVFLVVLRPARTCPLITLIHPSAWKRNSRKFAVASGLSTQWQVLDNRPWRTPLGSKRLRLGSSSCTSLYQGVATRSGATTREILVHRAGPLQTHTRP